MKRSLLYQVGGEDAVPFELLLEEVLLGEQLGIDTVWCFPSAGEDGDFGGAAPEIWLSALASHTERIRIGWGLAGVTPPTYPPMRVAEQGAALDLGSKGRLDVGLLPEGELADGSRADWQEGYRMLVDMWDEPKFSWTSERFEVKPIDVVPKPIQRPHPPIWLVGWSEEHARRAGAGGLGYLDVSGGDDELIELHRDAYRASRAEVDPLDLVCIHAFGVVGDLEPGAEASQRLSGWEALEVDHAVVRAGPVVGGHDAALDRIRLLTSAETQVH
jgi:alkanesulfonate monooxygenase SsuD/methylene tetrahydromethanopterin reductase-like flavin-dependent oxidoreductase (luciferase family)